MLSTSIIVFKLKKIFLPAVICMFILLMLVFSKSNISSSQSGLALWANSVVPSLLPFFVATELLSHTFVVPLLGRTLNGIMRPLFNVPGEGAFALIMGIISGYPTGAKIVSNFYKDGICTKQEAERLIAFTNNSGPLFIVGSVGVSMFGDTRTGILLLITHIFACLTVGVLFRFWKMKEKSHYSTVEPSLVSSSNIYKNDIAFSNLGEVLATAIMNSINTILLVGGFVVLFSVIISVLNQSHIFAIFFKILEPVFVFLKIDSRFISGILNGLIELTNGIKIVSAIPVKNISQNVIISSCLLGFGGICVLLQVFSIVSKAKLSIKPYIIGKVLHGIFAALYTYLFLTFSTFFNLDLL